MAKTKPKLYSGHVKAVLITVIYLHIQHISSTQQHNKRKKSHLLSFWSTTNILTLSLFPFVFTCRHTGYSHIPPPMKTKMVIKTNKIIKSFSLSLIIFHPNEESKGSLGTFERLPIVFVEETWYNKEITWVANSNYCDYFLSIVFVHFVFGFLSLVFRINIALSVH